jgi:hypothetical protein
MVPMVMAVPVGMVMVVMVVMTGAQRHRNAVRLAGTRAFTFTE